MWAIHLVEERIATGRGKLGRSTDTNFVPLVTDQLRQGHALSIQKSLRSPRKRQAWQSNHHVVSWKTGMKSSTQVPSFGGTPKDLPSCPRCRHPMQWTYYGEGDDFKHWACCNVKNCGAKSSSMGMWRWHCCQCATDMCDKCRSNALHKKPIPVRIRAPTAWSKPRQPASKRLSARSAGDALPSEEPQPLSPASLPSELDSKPRKPRKPSALSSVAGQEEFKAYYDWCNNKFGGLVCSWRALDTDGNMKISRHEFFSQLKQLQFAGDVEKLWSILDRDDSGVLKFQHYSPEAAVALASFRQFANHNYGSVASLITALNEEEFGTRNIIKSEFLGLCDKYCLGTPEIGDIVWQMYGQMEPSVKEPRRMKTSDLRNLDHWIVPEYFFVDADEDGFLEMKKELIAVHRGNALAAWRKDFDRDGSMRVNYPEFQRACKKIQGKTGKNLNIPGDWRALDANLSDWVSLKEFDLRAYKSLVDFKRGATENFGSCRKFIEQTQEEYARPISKNVFQRALWKSAFWWPEYLPPKTVPEEFTSWEQPISSEAEHLKYAEEEFNHAAMELFDGLDVDSSGFLTSADVFCVDIWSFEQEKAEELAWENLAETQQDVRSNFALKRSISWNQRRG